MTRRDSAGRKNPTCTDLTLCREKAVGVRRPRPSLKHSTAACGTHHENRPQLVEGASNSRAAAATRAQSFASASALAAKSSAQSFASAAVAPRVGIGIPAGQALRDTHGYLLTKETSGLAARLPRRGPATYADPHLGTGVQHRRRRHRRLAARMLAMCQGCPRHRARTPVWLPRGRKRLQSIRGISLST